jgi:LysM repeat protein
VSTREQIPYEYTLNVQGVTGTDQAEVHSELEQLQVNLLEGEELDVKAVLSFSTTVMKNIPLEAIEGVEEQEIDSNVLAGLPSAVIYIAAPGDDLWSIGRKYHMPVKTVRELNALESDELRPGQKVLLVKGLA